MLRPLPLAAAREVPADVHESFDYYDRNRTGFLDYLELQEALRGYGFDATVGECIDLIRAR